MRKGLLTNCSSVIGSHGHRIQRMMLDEEDVTYRAKWKFNGVKIKKTLHFLALLFVAVMMSGLLSACGETKEEEQERIAVMHALNDIGCIPDEWREIGYTHPWGSETPNYTSYIYYYINDKDYEKYRECWDFSDIDPADLYEGINEECYDFFMKYCPEPVFHAVYVLPLSNSEDTEYGGVMLKKNRTYYRVDLYDRAVYYQYISEYKDEKNYSGGIVSSYDESTLITSYIFYNDKGSWKLEQLTFD